MTEDEGNAFFARIEYLEKKLAEYQKQENKVSDILAGRDEVVKNLKLAIINAQGLALRTDIEKMDELKLAISMAQASLAVFNALLEPRSVIAEIDNNAA